MRTPRSAFTLVEMLVVMSVTSVLFGMMSLSLYAIFRTSSSLNDGVAAAAQQQRFAAQLRSDAHESRSAILVAAEEPADSAATLQLARIDGRSIEYRLQKESVARTVRAGDTVVSVESYRVLPALDQGWILDDTRPTPLLTVHLHQQVGSETNRKPARPPLSVQAALGIACLRRPANPEPATIDGGI